MEKPIDLTKVDLSKLLPPPGVPCARHSQAVMMCELHNAGLLEMEYNNDGKKEWEVVNLRSAWVVAPFYSYRIKPPPPLRFERETEEITGGVWTRQSPNLWVMEMMENMKKARVKIIVEEVRE